MAGVLATAWSALVARISSGRPGERTAPGGEGEEGAEGAEGAEGEQLEAPPPIKQEELEQQLQAASHPRTVALTLALTPTLPTLIAALPFPNLSPYLPTLYLACLLPTNSRSRRSPPRPRWRRCYATVRATLTHTNTNTHT